MQKAKATNAITELFGVRIAFKAMLEEYLSIGNREFYYNSKTSDVIVTADQLFFITYSKVKNKLVHGKKYLMKN